MYDNKCKCKVMQCVYDILYDGFIEVVLGWAFLWMYMIERTDRRGQGREQLGDREGTGRLTQDLTCWSYCKDSTARTPAGESAARMHGPTCRWPVLSCSLPLKLESPLALSQASLHDLSISLNPEKYTLRSNQLTWL